MPAPPNRQPLTRAWGLLLFIGAWVLLNLLQAALLHVDVDEAYYWFYSRHLAWGYFDHPPLVALSVKLGELVGHGSFYTRFGTVLFSAGTIYVGYKALPYHLASVRWYLLVFASAVLLHVYSFVATPDAPLLFFTVLFFYAYQRFLKTETVSSVLLLALAITGLFYSKYQGVLPVFFTVLSNPRLLLKPKVWGMAALVFMLFSPHLWWQYQHDWPTVRYHLIERGAGAYQLSDTTSYIAGQLLLWGPLTTLPALFYFSRYKYTFSVYERAHMFTLWGVLLVFFLSSFRSNVEPHWTLIAGPSYIVLMLKGLSVASAKMKRRFTRLFAGSIFIILVARLLMVLPGVPLNKIDGFTEFIYGKQWAAGVHTLAAGTPVVFEDSYKLPALYQYYFPDVITWGYNTLNYRKSEYDVLGNAFLNNRRVFIATPRTLEGATHFFKSPYKPLYFQAVDSFKAINAVKIKWINPVRIINTNHTLTATLAIVNTGTDTINTAGLQLQYAFYKNRYEQYPTLVAWPFAESTIPPATTKQFTMTLIPPRLHGRYNLLFSIVQPPLAGNFASRFYQVLLKQD